MLKISKKNFHRFTFRGDSNVSISSPLLSFSIWIRVRLFFVPLARISVEWFEVFVLLLLFDDDDFCPRWRFDPFVRWEFVEPSCLKRRRRRRNEPFSNILCDSGCNIQYEPLPKEKIRFDLNETMMKNKKTNRDVCRHVQLWRNNRSMINYVESNFANLVCCLDNTEKDKEKLKKKKTIFRREFTG